MFDGAGWIFGGTALATLAVGCWSQLKAIGRQLLSRMIASFDVQYPVLHAVNCFVRDRLTASPFSSPRYDGLIVNVRPRAREQMVVCEEPSYSGKFYWLGWRPIWLQLHHDALRGGYMTIWYIRGTFDSDALMIQVAEHYNETVLGVEGVRNSAGRYCVNHVFGTSGKQIVHQSAIIGSAGCNQPTAENSGRPECDRDRRTKRLLKWTHDDIGPNLLGNGRSIDRLALSEEASRAVAEFEQWLALESWYKSRGIPWRKNWLLYGPPGTGKSSIVQAIAEDHDLPIWVFDLATLYNDELHREWSRMLAEVPCIALLEDLDKVFEGSGNVSKGDLTLDCLLNCIDGVSRATGLFLVMTTNRIEALDPALKRPGRADSILEMAAPDFNGRVKIASRILPDQRIGSWKELAGDHAGKSGAEFQRICEEVALEELRGERAETPQLDAEPRYSEPVF